MVHDNLVILVVLTELLTCLVESICTILTTMVQTQLDSSKTGGIAQTQFVSACLVLLLGTL